MTKPPAASKPTSACRELSKWHTSWRRAVEVDIACKLEGLAHHRRLMMAIATESRIQASTISPSLTVNDLQRSITFFEGLGFAVSDRWEDQGRLLGVMVSAGDVSIGLSQDDWKKGRDREKGVGMRLYIETKQDIDQIASRARAAGVQLDGDPHQTEWKTRAFEVTEPSGFKITISSESQT